MILSTHAIAGAALAATLPTSNPLIIFCAAFLSHFLLDAIPHWEYDIKSYKEDPKNRLHADMVYGKAFLYDLSRIGLDILLGVVVSYAFFQPEAFTFTWNLDFAKINWLILVGAVGGIVPDFLQFAYWKLKIYPLKLLQSFHMWIHAKIRLTDRPLLGIPLQILLVIVIVLVGKKIQQN